CPAQIPRSFLRSFSLWARHPAVTSAELNVRLGEAEFFPGASRQVRRVRNRRREGHARTAQESATGRESCTRFKPPIRRSAPPLLPYTTHSRSVPRPDPPLLPSIIFPLGHARAFIDARLSK